MSPFSFPLLRETNLKVREPFPETAALGEDVAKLSKFDGERIHSLTRTYTHQRMHEQSTSYIFLGLGVI